MPEVYSVKVKRHVPQFFNEHSFYPTFVKSVYVRSWFSKCNPWEATAALPVNLETQTLRPHPKHLRTETLEVGPNHLCFNENAPGEFCCLLKFETHQSKTERSICELTSYVTLGK